LVGRINPDRVLAVVVELVERGEYIALGRLLDAATDRIVVDAAAAISDEALLRIGFYAESSTHLTRAVAALPEQRLRSVVACALAGPPDLLSAGLALIARLEDDRLRGRLADYAADASEATLIGLVATATEVGAVPELLSAVAVMGPRARQRILALPAFAGHHTLTDLIRTTAAHHR
jgi:hypothetical protein